MSTNSIPTAKLEAVNDMIAEHHASDDALRNSLSVSLRDLG